MQLICSTYPISRQILSISISASLSPVIQTALYLYIRQNAERKFLLLLQCHREVLLGFNVVLLMNAKSLRVNRTCSAGIYIASVNRILWLMSVS